MIQQFHGQRADTGRNDGQKNPTPSRATTGTDRQRAEFLRRLRDRAADNAVQPFEHIERIGAHCIPSATVSSKRKVIGRIPVCLSSGGLIRPWPAVAFSASGSVLVADHRSVSSHAKFDDNMNERGEAFNGVCSQRPGVDDADRVQHHRARLPSQQ